MTGTDFVKYLEEKLGLKKHEESSDQFKQHGLYVREDDQDWGSSGENDLNNSSKA